MTQQELADMVNVTRNAESEVSVVNVLTIMQILKEWCAKQNPEYVRLFELIQEYRKWGKLKSTYIDGYFSHINDETYRKHPDFMPRGKETGRCAACNPNLQNCPRKTNDPIGVQNFIYATSGSILMSLDFS